ncbi:UNVERIFIED_CONTAM: Retrovirus-related Pol polyprotein from transposon TNT 1-94 [Sesamum indicum]
MLIFNKQLGEEFFMMKFISGLKEEIKGYVATLKSCNQAIMLARKQESVVDAIIKNTQQLLKNNPLKNAYRPVKTEPLSYEDATHERKWRKAIDEEIKPITKNDTWELVPLPKDKNAIGVKWVYKIKRNAKGEIEKNKAILVAKGYKQKIGTDYNEVFAHVARLESIRLIISLATQNHWKIHQIDVKFTFLNGVLKEEVYITQPLGYVVQGQENKAIALAKNPVLHEKSKHIDTRYHFIRECISKEEVKLEYVKSQDQVANIFTKPLKSDVFKRLRCLLGVMNLV